MTWKVPSRSISITDLKPLALSWLANAGKFPAAPDTTTSSGPNRSQIPAMPASIASASRTSAENPAASLPRDSSARIVSATLSSLRLATATRAPWLANNSATPRLMPLVPPTTNTVFPLKSSISPSHISILSNQTQHGRCPHLTV